MPSDFHKIPRSLSAGRGALSSLSQENKIKLVVERNELEPDYKLGIVGGPLYTKDEVINQVQEKTKRGLALVDSEMNYVNRLVSDLSSGDSPSLKPQKPKIEPEKRPTSSGGKKLYRARALFCEDTATDDLTKDAAEYRKEEVHAAFKKRGFQLRELEGTETDRKHVKAEATNKKVAYFSGIGHGDANEYTGHNGTMILKTGKTEPEEVKGKVVHLLSCLTAQKLGPYLVKKGARAYAGYFEEFWAIQDQENTPIDEMDLFWECDSMFDLMMLSGATVKKAHAATIDMFDAAIDLVPNTITASSLLHDQYYFRSPVSGKKYGVAAARISAWTKGA